MGVKSVLKSASTVVKNAVGKKQDARDRDLLDTLKTEHNEVKGLLKDLQKATGAPQRKALVRQIKTALVPHTKAEGKVLYSALIKSRD